MSGRSFWLTTWNHNSENIQGLAGIHACGPCRAQYHHQKLINYFDEPSCLPANAGQC